MFSSWEELETECKKCRKCGLCETRINTVFGKGSKDAEVLFIGEAPGKNEDLQGEPFVGRSGKLLDLMLSEIGLDRDKNIFIANIVKCRPPENRDPKPAEQEQCIEWLKEQIRILNPKIIVCLGRIASCKIISPDFKITKQHGEFIKKNGILYMGTFHPASLLRNPKQKPEAMNDYFLLKEKIKEICRRTY